MTQLFEKAVDVARTLSPELQDEVARLVIAFAGREHVVQVVPEQDALFIEHDAMPGEEVAADQEVRALWAKYGI